MRVERKELQAALNAVRPALASKDPLTQLLCFWFSGKRLYAFNNIIGIDVPLASDFQGGVAGATLLGMVGSSIAKFADLAVEKNNLILKMGSSRSKFPSLPFEDSVWSFPKLPKEAIAIDDTFCQCLSRTLVCATDEVGVSLICDGKRLSFFSTNDKAMAYDSIKAPAGLEATRVEIPPIFCEQVLSLCSGGGKLYFSDDAVLAVSDNDERIFSRILSSGNPLDYDKAVKTSLPKGYKEKLVPIPGKLAAAMDRAMVLANGDHAPVEHAITDGTLVLNFKSNLGSLTEKIKLDQPADDVAVVLDVGMVKKGIVKADSLLLTEQNAVFGWGKSGGAFVVAALA